MVKEISCVTSRCGNRCKALSTQNTCLVNIIPLVAEIIPDNWRSFSFWHQVFVFGDFSLVRSCYQRLTPCAGAWSASHTELELMWLVDCCTCRVCMHSVWNSMSLFASYMASPAMWLLRTGTLRCQCSNDLLCSSILMFKTFMSSS